MGIVNAMKTGNIFIDMVIAMCIPMIFGVIISSIGKLQEKMKHIHWMRLIGQKHRIYERFIRHSTITTSYGSTTNLGGDSKNELLIKAIQLYLDNHSLLKLNAADLELKSFGEDKKNNYYDYYYGGGKSTNLSDTLSKYNVVKKPIKGKWVSLGMFESVKENKQCEVNLVVSEDIGEDGSKSESKNHRRELTLRFRSEGKDSIDNFIDKAYRWYLDELRKLEDDSRYMYELITPKKITSNSDSSDVTNQKYKRYQLSDEKTFESLFFQQKESVVGIVDHFVNKTGKYGVKGYPHKLGLLLHGPPGTGKTSLIKVLAQHTGRSIINVPLSRISTNAELASIFFDRELNVNGQDVAIPLCFKDVIFVMEDIDAVSKIVRRRDGKTAAQMGRTEQFVETPDKKSLWRMILESSDISCKELAKELINKSERLKKAAHDPQTLSATAHRMARVPGISLIGENAENDTIRKIAKEATSSVTALMQDYATVDSFLGKHARSLKQILDTGSEINEAFENKLLGIYPDGAPSVGSFVSLCSSDLPGEESITQLSKDTANIRVETNNESIVVNYEDDSEFGTKSSLKSNKCIGPKIEGMGYSNSTFRDKRDDLNLSGILNVLDGVVDTPGRMLIITTNHPETLDPALIRPGRIDKKLMLGYMVGEDVVSMVEHYFQTNLVPEQVERVKRSIGSSGVLSRPSFSLKISPAEVEQMASEFEEAEEMIVAIENKASLKNSLSCLG